MSIEFSYLFYSQTLQFSLCLPLTGIIKDWLSKSLAPKSIYMLETLGCVEKCFYLASSQMIVIRIYILYFLEAPKVILLYGWGWLRLTLGDFWWL